MEANGRHFDLRHFDLRLEELLHAPVALAIFDVNMIKWLDWLQSLKQFCIDGLYVLVASLTLMALISEPSELGWLHVLMTH